MALGWRFKRNKPVGEGVKPPRKFDYDLLVLGAGAAGLVAAYAGAMAKGKTALIEANEMGGDCLNSGCVPSKALISHAKSVHHIVKNGAKIPASMLKPKNIYQKISQSIEKIAPHDSKQRYESLGVDVFQGYGKFIDPWHVNIDYKTANMTLSARSIVIATGAEPIIPNLKGAEDAPILTSETLWDELAKWNKLPSSMVILGGGPIGCELAQSFQRLGVEVTIVEMAAHILAREEQAAAKLATDILSDEGVRLLTRYQALEFKKEETQQKTTQHSLIVKNLKNNKEMALSYDILISAIGRRPRLSGFGLEEIGIKLENHVMNGAYLETNFPHIYTAGDVAGPWQFTHAAGAQGFIAAINGLFGDLWRMKSHHQMMPRVTYLDPEIAAIGISENEAKTQNISHEVTFYGLDDLDRAIAESGGVVSDKTGFVKIITKAKTDKILGVTIMGARAGEMLTPFLMALNQGKGLKAILRTTMPYPTWGEGAKMAAGQWQKAHLPDSALRLLKHYHRWRRK